MGSTGRHPFLTRKGRQRPCQLGLELLVNAVPKGRQLITPFWGNRADKKEQPGVIVVIHVQ